MLGVIGGRPDPEERPDGVKGEEANAYRWMDGILMRLIARLAML